MKTKNKILGAIFTAVLAGAIDVGDNAMAGLSPTGKILNIPSSAFDYSESCGNARGSYIADNSTSSDCGIAIPIPLPSGSEIVGITATVNSGTDDEIIVTMQSMDMSDASTDNTLALTVVRGSTGGVSKESVEIGAGSVWVERDKSYQIMVSLDGDDPSTGLPRIYGVSLTYK